MSTTSSGSLKNVKISGLKKANWNPKSRQREISTLKTSIERVGLLYPILVSKGMDVVDGHRRLAACESLGWESIPVLVVEGEQAELFQEVSSVHRPMRGNETLNVYLKEPRAIGMRARSRIQGCEQVVGKAMIRRLAAGGFSMATWDISRRLCTLADSDTAQTHKAVLNWMIKYRSAGVTESALRAGVSVDVIMSAIRRGKPIKAGLVVTEA